MTKPIPDKAEVALEYPDKLYIGTFERSSRFDAHLDATGISLMLERIGDVDCSPHEPYSAIFMAVWERDSRAKRNAGERVSGASKNKDPLLEAATCFHRLEPGLGLRLCFPWSARGLIPA